MLTADVSLLDEATPLAEAQARNPGLRVQATEVERARLGLQLARRSRLPDFTIGPSYETEPDTKFYSLSLSLPLPLWDQKKGEIRGKREDVWAALPIWLRAALWVHTKRTQGLSFMGHLVAIPAPE